MERTRKEEERILTQAEEFLERYGLTVYVKKFLDSEEAQKRIAISYSELVKDIKYVRENAPNDLKEKADKLYEEFVAHKQNFSADAGANLKIRIYTSLDLLDKSILDALEESGILKQSFAKGNEALGKDISEIAHSMKKELCRAFVEMLYEGYREEGYSKRWIKIFF